jgi:hypothetical protein
MSPLPMAIRPDEEEDTQTPTTMAPTSRTTTNCRVRHLLPVKLDDELNEAEERREEVFECEPVPVPVFAFRRRGLKEVDR